MVFKGVKTVPLLYQFKAVVQLGKTLPRGITRRRDRFFVRVSVNGKMEYVGDYLTLSEAQTALMLARGDAIRGQFKSAAQKRAELQAAREAEQQAQAEKVLVKEWAVTWLELLAADVDDGRLTMATYRDYKSVLGAYILPAIGDLPMSAVTRRDIGDMIAGITSPRAQQKAISAARRIFNTAIEHGQAGVTDSPVVVKLHKAPSGSLKAEHIATPEQVKAIADAMPEGLGLTVLLAAWCQCRQGEVLGLQRRDFIDLEGNATVRIERQWNQKTMPPRYTPTKAKDTRMLSIPAVLVPVIKDHLDSRVGEDPESPVFESARWAGKPISQSNHNKWWAKAKQQAGVPATFRFHDLRHTGLTIYAQQGATLAELMARGGHKNVEVVMRYQHAAAERDRQLAAKMPVIV